MIISGIISFYFIMILYLSVTANTMCFLITTSTLYSTTPTTLTLTDYGIILSLYQTADSCLLECGHTVLCFQCASMLARKVPNSCPLCRMPIQYVVRITCTVPPDPSFDPITDPITHGRTIAVAGEGYMVNAEMVHILSTVRAARAALVPPTAV